MNWPPPAIPLLCLKSIGTLPITPSVQITDTIGNKMLHLFIGPKLMILPISSACRPPNLTLSSMYPFTLHMRPLPQPQSSLTKQHYHVSVIQPRHFASHSLHDVCKRTSSTALLTNISQSHDASQYNTFIASPHLDTTLKRDPLMLHYISHLSVPS